MGRDDMMHGVRFLTLLLAGVLCPQPALLDAQGAEARSKPESKRPALSVKASPPSGMAPVRLSLTGELKGGPDDFAEFYCPAVEWTWGDGTVSESSADCDPFEPGTSAIQRRYSIQHVYQLPGRFQIQLRLKKKGKTVATATTAVQILGVVSGGGEP